MPGVVVPHPGARHLGLVDRVTTLGRARETSHQLVGERGRIRRYPVDQGGRHVIQPGGPHLGGDDAQTGGQVLQNLDSGATPTQQRHDAELMPGQDVSHHRWVGDERDAIRGARSHDARTGIATGDRDLSRRHPDAPRATPAGLLNIGCIPSKALIHAADQFEKAGQFAHDSPLGIRVESPRIEWRRRCDGRTGSSRAHRRRRRAAEKERRAGRPRLGPHRRRQDSGGHDRRRA